MKLLEGKILILHNQFLHVVKVSDGRLSQMADGHLGRDSNVQLCLVDFKVCDWPTENQS